MQLEEQNAITPAKTSFRKLRVCKRDPSGVGSIPSFPKSCRARTSPALTIAPLRRTMEQEGSRQFSLRDRKSARTFRKMRSELSIVVGFNLSADGLRSEERRVGTAC